MCVPGRWGCIVQCRYQWSGFWPAWPSHPGTCYTTTGSDPLCDGAGDVIKAWHINFYCLTKLLLRALKLRTLYLPPQDRARVCRTWSVCRAEGSRWSVGSGREAPNTAGTSFRMHGCRSYKQRQITVASARTALIWFSMGTHRFMHVYWQASYQKIDKSDVSTSISTRESTIFVWKMMVFIILPSSLWSAIPRLALETLV